MTRRIDASKARTAFDERLSAVPVDDFTVPTRGWIRAIRDALRMSAADLGDRLGVSHSAVFEFERSEQGGTIGLGKLRRAAEAMDCELVYAFVPRNGLERTIRTRAEQIVDDALSAADHSMALEDQAVEPSTPLREELIDQVLAAPGLWSRRA